jgi:hypothetical protein
MIVINQEILNKIEKEKKISELKKFLSESDFRMTLDYFETMLEDQKQYWTNERKKARDEIKSLE